MSIPRLRSRGFGVCKVERSRVGGKLQTMLAEYSLMGSGRFCLLDQSGRPVELVLGIDRPDR